MATGKLRLVNESNRYNTEGIRDYIRTDNLCVNYGRYDYWGCIFDSRVYVVRLEVPREKGVHGYRFRVHYRHDICSTIPGYFSGNPTGSNWDTLKGFDKWDTQVREDMWFNKIHKGSGGLDANFR